MSTQLSANLDVALAKARSIGAGMLHAHELVSEYALDGHGHMNKLLRLPHLIRCVLQRAKLVRHFLGRLFPSHI